MQLVKLLLVLLLERILSLFELLLFVIELFPHPLVVRYLQLQALLLDFDEPVDPILLLLH